MESLRAFIFGTLLLITLLLLPSEAVEKKLIEEIHVCKRSQSQLAKCFCENFNKVLPLLKDAVPAMGFPAFDPFQVEHIEMVSPETPSFNLIADLQNLSLSGLTNAKAECEATITENGIQLYLDVNFPEITLQSNYKVKGNFLSNNLDTDGDFHGKLTGVRTRSIWNSTLFMKNGKEHLKYSVGSADMSIKQIQMYFNNLLGNHTELNDNINKMINSNIDLFYNELKPVLWAAIKEISIKLINNFYEIFPYDVLYPEQ